MYIMYTIDLPKFIVSNQGSKFLILHVFNTISFINASICHFSDFWSICHAFSTGHDTDANNFFIKIKFLDILWEGTCVSLSLDTFPL